MATLVGVLLSTTDTPPRPHHGGDANNDATTAIFSTNSDNQWNKQKLRAHLGYVDYLINVYVFNFSSSQKYTHSSIGHIHPMIDGFTSNLTSL